MFLIYLVVVATIRIHAAGLLLIDVVYALEGLSLLVFPAFLTFTFPPSRTYFHTVSWGLVARPNF